MEQAQNQSGVTGAHRRQIDFAPSKPLYPPLRTSNSKNSSASTHVQPEKTPSTSGTANNSSAQSSSSISPSEADRLANMVANLPSVGGSSNKSSGTPTHARPANSHAPQSSVTPTSSPYVLPTTPVTSAKAAINAMYAEQTKHASAAPAPSARELVNASAGQPTSPKSAASFHHGSIQRSMESTRTSASAILKMAKTEQPNLEDLQPGNSADPLTSSSAVTRGLKKVESDEIPVVRTSLKLGKSGSRQKQTAVVLPANSRMAQAARSVEAPELPTRSPGRLARLIGGRRQPTNRRTITAGNSRAIASGIDNYSVPVPSSSSQLALGSGVRDPQMVPAPANYATSNSTRFRTKPRNYSVSQPQTLSVDSSYVMTTPPKLSSARTASANLGVVEDYHPPKAPAIAIGDRAPIGQIKTQRVASGHGGPAPLDSSFEADATAKYSFLQKAKKPTDNNRYALGGQSPFLKSVSVEKRPLSDNAKPYDYSVRTSEKTGVKPGSKLSKKNVYSKKKSPKPDLGPRQDLPTRPTVIIPASRRSKLPLFFLLLFTILLGAVVGAAVYLCFFQ